MGPHTLTFQCSKTVEAWKKNKWRPRVEPPRKWEPVLNDELARLYLKMLTRYREKPGIDLSPSGFYQFLKSGMHHLGICGFRLNRKGEDCQALKLAAAAVESEGEELVCLCSEEGKLYNIEEIFENLEIVFSTTESLSCSKDRKSVV